MKIGTSSALFEASRAYDIVAAEMDSASEQLQVAEIRYGSVKQVYDKASETYLKEFNKHYGVKEQTK